MGPFRIAASTDQVSHRFAAMLRAGRKLHLLTVVAPHSIGRLEAVERQLRAFIARNPHWAFRFDGLNEGAQLRGADGKSPTMDDIEITAILAGVGTAGGSVRTPGDHVRMLALPDFITIFDSLESAEELNRYWAYVDGHSGLMGFRGLTGPSDLFGSFRDADAELIAGANTPTFIGLHPHWGSNWRFNQLSEFWGIAPPRFPSTDVMWEVEKKRDGMQRVEARGRPTMAWGIQADDCTVYILFTVAAPLGDLAGRMLEHFVHRIADAMAQRMDILQGHPLFQRKLLVMECSASAASRVLSSRDELPEDLPVAPLLSNWQIASANDAELSVHVDVDIAQMLQRIDNVTGSAFEVDSLIEAVSGMSTLLKLAVDPAREATLLATRSRSPRFNVTQMTRTVDVPDFSIPIEPAPQDFKVARRELAIVLKEGHSEPGRYELADAKPIIDAARNEYRSRLHVRIAQLDRESLLRFCLQQHDELISKFRRDSARIQLSLKHEVSFDRSASMAEAQAEYVKSARNYRYLLECCLSAPMAGAESASTDTVRRLIATVDWLFVLYSASDTLHNDIEVAGLDIDRDYVPEVFYSEDRTAVEEAYGREMARIKLGIGMREDDGIHSPSSGARDIATLDGAFTTDLGFSFSHLISVLKHLAQWSSLGGDTELRFLYEASIERLQAVILPSITTLSVDELERVIGFLCRR